MLNQIEIEVMYLPPKMVMRGEGAQAIIYFQINNCVV